MLEWEKIKTAAQRGSAGRGDSKREGPGTPRPPKKGGHYDTAVN